MNNIPKMLNSLYLFSSLTILFLLLSNFLLCQDEVWLDPKLDLDADSQIVMVWFEDQYLETGDSYIEKTKQFTGIPRSQVRRLVKDSLKILNSQSFSKIAFDLSHLVDNKYISDVKRHWIINGFSCTVLKDGLQKLRSLEGVSKIFIKSIRMPNLGEDMGPEFLSSLPPNDFDPEKVDSVPWNIEMIKAQEVWNEFGLTGEGVLNIIHDSGFKLDTPPLASTIYINDGEVPGNGIDDDLNGYIDDYHGYNFDSKDANLNQPRIRRGTNIHGNLCAAMVTGTYATDSKYAIGIAPDSRWSPLIGSSNIEEAVEWAIEQGADTYSMSFSQPNLGEYRSHWRMVLEQATLCGIVFISGAGNFASGSNAAPVPVQMRNPEDIPYVVLGVAGVGRDGLRPSFSSQGPVEWNTEYYKDGRVDKPDFATINSRVPCVDPEGRLENMASGNSLAGPHMAGIVSLMLSANQDLLPWEIREILIEVAEDIGAPGFDYQTGYGFVNAYDAVKAVLNRK